MLTLEGVEEKVKEEEELKILTLNKLLTRLSVLLAQKKLAIIHANIKIKPEKPYIFYISIIKSL